jgi:RNA polymerase sigma-70 factor (ECF subfamily)
MPEHPVDRQEFEQLALEHLEGLYRMALKLTRHPDEASELVQETYLKALRHASSFEEKGKGMRAWLFTILHNTFYSDIRRRKRTATPVDEFFDAASDERIPDEAPVVWNLASLDWEHVDDRLKKAIEDLSEEHREVLLLWGVEGMKYREISTILAVPIGTVMSRLHRARKILADSLEDFAAEVGFTTVRESEDPGANEP